MAHSIKDSPYYSCRSIQRIVIFCTPVTICPYCVSSRPHIFCLCRLFRIKIAPNILLDCDSDIKCIIQIWLTTCSYLFHCRATRTTTRTTTMTTTMRCGQFIKFLLVRTRHTPYFKQSFRWYTGLLLPAYYILYLWNSCWRLWINQIGHQHFTWVHYARYRTHCLCLHTFRPTINCLYTDSLHSNSNDIFLLLLLLLYVH